jgi:hypothetical protein
MGPAEIVFLAFAITTSLLVFIARYRLIGALIEAIEKFRGGPPAGMHPSPANDLFLLSRRIQRVKASDSEAYCRSGSQPG